MNSIRSFLLSKTQPVSQIRVQFQEFRARRKGRMMSSATAAGGSGGTVSSASQSAGAGVSSVPPPAAEAASSEGLSQGGKVFFGGLCAATFGLGTWQVQRLFEKWELIEIREKELAMDPTTKWDSDKFPYQRRVVQGVFRYDKEVLVGPRGAPPGVKLPRQGLSSKSGGAANSGMAPGPQGYHVLTPLQVPVLNPDGTKKSERLLWINRGWVPKTMVPDPRRGGENGAMNNNNNNNNATNEDPSMLNWSRPQGRVAVMAIRSEIEKPRVMTPEHDYTKRPLQLFWLDGIALQAISEEPNEEIIYMTQVTNVDPDDDGKKGNNSQNAVKYPLVPPVKSMAEFKTTPMIHMGYATTWYGLFTAGVYMTRKLITRGRA